MSFPNPPGFFRGEQIHLQDGEQASATEAAEKLVNHKRTRGIRIKPQDDGSVIVVYPRVVADEVDSILSELDVQIVESQLNK